MGSPEKPFSCLESGCGASFTNEDRLSVHARKHDMVLQLGAKGGAFVADQTPTPTRFIRNCEEVGLFQDLQNVNPFEETFKRAMEVRTGTNHLTLDGHLMTTTSDDTLHTPHIFPHLPEENSSGLYSGNTERTNLTVNRLSSDEGSNQLTVVKCMSSSVEDNLSSVGLHDNDKDEKHDRKVTVLVERKIKKKLSSSSSKSKLTRQNSIDLPDELTTPGMREFSHIILSSGSQRKVVNAKDNEQSSIGLKDSTDTEDSRVLQIPVISISETPKSNANSLNAPVQNDGNNTTLNEKSDVQRMDSIGDLIVTKKFLDVKSCLKSNYSKLISQKSIDMALVHFTNEAHSKMMDLNNISIEDLPDSTSVIKESVSCSQNELKIVNEGNVQTVNQHKRFLLVKSKSGSRNTSQDSEKNLEMNVQRNDEQADTVRLESIGGNISSNSLNSGYELMLKWPDGKKVYLKEVHRDAKNTTEQTENAAPESFQQASTNQRDETVVKTANMKQKLKDFIHNSSQQVNDNTTLNQLPMQNSITILPENYMIVPQITSLDPNVPVSTVLTSNIQFVSVCSPATKVQSQIFFPSKDVFNPLRQIIPDSNPTQPNVIRTISGGNIYGGDEVIILPKPSLQTTAPPIVIKDSFNLNSFLNENVAIKKRTVDNLGSTLNEKAKILKTTKATAKSLGGTSSQREAKGGETPESKRQMIQERNRAAVWRYRVKKQNKFQVLQETNKKLEKMNQDLMEKLQAAMEEIQGLRQALALRADSDRKYASYRPPSVITPSQRSNQYVVINNTFLEKTTQPDINNEPSKTTISLGNINTLNNPTNPAKKELINNEINHFNNLDNVQSNHSYVKVINDTPKNVIQNLRMPDNVYDVNNASANLNSVHDSGNIITIDLNTPSDNINSPFDDNFGKDPSKGSMTNNSSTSVINSTSNDIFKVLNTKSVDISRSRNESSSEDLKTPTVSNMAMFLKEVQNERNAALAKQDGQTDLVITANMK